MSSKSPHYCTCRYRQTENGKRLHPVLDVQSHVHTTGIRPALTHLIVCHEWNAHAICRHADTLFLCPSHKIMLRPPMPLLDVMQALTNMSCRHVHLKAAAKICLYKVQYGHPGIHLASHIHMGQLEILSSTPSNSLTCIHILTINRIL